MNLIEITIGDAGVLPGGQHLVLQTVELQAPAGSQATLNSRKCCAVSMPTCCAAKARPAPGGARCGGWSGKAEGPEQPAAGCGRRQASGMAEQLQSGVGALPVECSAR